MGKKRSLVDAALSAGRLSEVFTQDIEDMAANGATPNEPPAQAERKAPAQAQAQQERPPSQERRRSQFEEFTAWVEQQGKTTEDVAAVIGMDATDGNIRAFVVENDIKDFSQYLVAAWSGQQPPPEEDGTVYNDAGLPSKPVGEGQADMPL